MTSLMRSSESSTGAEIANFSTEHLGVNTQQVHQPIHGDLQLIEQKHPLRTSLQYFIEQGFATHYQANVQQFMPHLLGVSLSDKWQAALGMRFASSGALFTEQYLPVPSEQVLLSHNVSCDRSAIAEIGHLYAQSRQALMQLFVLMVQALHQLKVQQLLFAATPDLKRLLTRHGIALTEIADASPECLGDKAQDWGSYYQRKPKVCALSVAQAAERIQSDPRLVQLIFKHWPQLHALVDTLKETI